MALDWSINRRKLLKAGPYGAALALSPTMPRFAWAADADTLRIRMDGDLQVLDPAFMIGGIEEPIMRGVYVSLNRFGDLRDGAPWMPHGAEKLETIEPTKIKFTLMPGMKWTNGFGAVTAEDVKFSYERIANPDNASPWAYQFEKLDKVEVIDERTGIIHLKEPYAPIYVVSLPYYGGHIISKAATEKAGGKFTTEPPATCGPYLLQSWEQKQKVTLAENPEWPGPKPAFKTVEIYVVEDDQAAQLAYEADSFDYTRIAVSSAKQTAAAPPAGTKFVEAQSTRYMWLTINVDSPRLKDPRIRQAIQHAIDVDQVLIGAFDSLTKRSTGVVQPGTKFARSGNLMALDIAKAQSLLKEAGAEGLSLTLHSLNDSTQTSVTQIMQASLEQAGFKVELMPVDEAVYWELGDKTKGDTYKNLDLVLMDFAGGVDPSENLVWFRPDQIGVYNWSAFNNPEFEDLYQKLVSETDEPKRVTMARRMEDLMEQSGGFVFICHEPLVLIHKDTINPVIYPDGHPNPVFFTKV